MQGQLGIDVVDDGDIGAWLCLVQFFLGQVRGDRHAVVVWSAELAETEGTQLIADPLGLAWSTMFNDKGVLECTIFSAVPSGENRVDTLRVPCIKANGAKAFNVVAGARCAVAHATVDVSQCGSLSLGAFHELDVASFLGEFLQGEQLFGGLGGSCLRGCLLLGLCRATSNDFEWLTCAGVHDRGQASHFDWGYIVAKFVVDVLHISNLANFSIDLQANCLWSDASGNDLLGLLGILGANLNFGLAVLDAGLGLNALVLKFLGDFSNGVVCLRVFQVLLRRLLQVALDGFVKSLGVYSDISGRRRSARALRRCWSGFSLIGCDCGSNKATANHQCGGCSSDNAALRSLVLWFWH